MCFPHNSYHTIQTLLGLRICLVSQNFIKLNFFCRVNLFISTSRFRAAPRPCASSEYTMRSTVRDLV